MSKFAEKLLILKSVGEGLLERLHYTKKVFASPTQRPSFVGDPQYQRVLAALLKRFPEFEPNVEKTPGYELLTSKAKVFYEELEAFYFNFVDSFEFKEAALGVLSEIGSNTVEMKLDENPSVTTAFLDLFSIYVNLNLLINSIEERKTILVVYYKLFFFIKCTNEPTFQRVANYMHAFNDPIKAMQEEFKSLSSSIGKTLVNFMAFYTKVRTVTLLRKEGSLNITLKPEDMPKPVTDKFIYQMQYAGSMSSWLVWGFLLCPETLSLPGAVDLCRFALAEGFVFPVFKNSTTQVHEHYDNLFSNYKSKTLNLTKQKKVIKDVWSEAVAKSSAKHRERRIYLRQELNSLLRLLSDKPGLLGPKFPMVVSGLALVQEEVFWYFRHIKAVPPKSVGKKLSEDDVRDNRISELIWLSTEMVKLVKGHRKIVQNYYLEYLRGADFSKLSQLCDTTWMNGAGQGIAKITKSILDELQAIPTGSSAANQKYDFKALRLNWFRVECQLSSLQSSLALTKVKDVVDRFNLVVQHTRYVDDLDELLDKTASLKQLWYWREPLFECFSRVIKDGPNQPLHAMSFLELLSEFPLNAGPNNSEEKQEIGTQSVNMGDKLLVELTTRVIALLNEVRKEYTEFDMQCADVNAAYPLLAKRKEGGTRGVASGVGVPTLPGTESEYRRRQDHDRLRLYERNAWQLCAALSTVDSILIYDHCFVPREFLREKIAEAFRKFIRSSALLSGGSGADAAGGGNGSGDAERHSSSKGGLQDEKLVQRPSVLEKQINVYASVLKLTENFVDIDIGEILREVYLSEVFIKAVGKSGTLDWIHAEEIDIKFEGAFIGAYVNWYADFVTKKLSSPGGSGSSNALGNNAIVFSPARKGFVSKAGVAFRAELYADWPELCALCNLVGPYGVKLIDREILKFILTNVNSIKDHLSHNRQVLDELAKSYHNDALANDTLRKLRDGDGFLLKAIGIGNALCFRSLLHEALSFVVQERTPFVFDTVKTAFSQYRNNTFMAPELLGIDLLAADCGLPLGTADQGLKKFLSKAIGSADAALMDLLPYMFAASFTSNVWKEAQFRPVIEGHSNNAHTLAKAINELIVAFKAITSSTADEREIAMLLKTFVEVSSVILLRMARNQTNKQDKHGPLDFPSIIIFMDRFIEESVLLTRDTLEECLPYALLRNEWKSVFSASRTSNKKETAATQDVF